MPSILTTMLRQQIRLLKPVFTRFSITASRNLQEILGELEAKTIGDKVELSTFHIGNQSAGMATPVDLKKADPRVALYLHGGGYVAGQHQVRSGFCRCIGGKMPDPGGICAYRLAPEHPYPAALEDVLAAYEYLLACGRRPEQICLIGESAGGGLVFCLCLLLQKLGRPLPGRIVALSPWVDLTLSGESYQTNRKADPTLTMEELEGLYSPMGRRTGGIRWFLLCLQALPPCLDFLLAGFTWGAMNCC